MKLWGGTVPSIILATNPAIQFMVYEALKRYFRGLLGVTVSMSSQIISEWEDYFSFQQILDKCKQQIITWVSRR